MKTAPRTSNCLSCGDVPWSDDGKCPRCKSRVLGEFTPDRVITMPLLLPVNTARVIGDIAKKREVSPSVLRLLTSAARQHLEDQHAADELLDDEQLFGEETEAPAPVVEIGPAPAPLAGPLFSRHGARHTRNRF